MQVPLAELDLAQASRQDTIRVRLSPMLTPYVPLMFTLTLRPTSTLALVSSDADPLYNPRSWSRSSSQLGFWRTFDLRHVIHDHRLVSPCHWDEALSCWRPRMNPV